MPKNITGVGLFIKILVRILYRKVELRFQCREANRRYDEVEDLMYAVGHAIRDRTPLFSRIHTSTFNNTGYATKDGKRISSLCWNSPIGMLVYLAEQPYLGLGVEFRGKVLCIRQMQGVQGSLPLSNLRDWPELLVKTCMVFAQENGFAEVRVYKANQDIDFEVPNVSPQDGQTYEEAVKAHRDRMYRRYDRTAQKLKFEKNKRYYRWIVPPQAQP